MSEISKPPTEAPAQLLDLKAALDAQQARAQARLAARQAVTECVEHLFDAAVEYAMAVPWKQWSDEQPVGSVLHVDDERLASTGDPVVLELLALLHAAQETVEHLE